MPFVRSSASASTTLFSVTFTRSALRTSPHFNRTQAHSSNLYFGASIAALRSLAVKKGYRFVGTNSAGNDAFFVREDYAGRFVEDSLCSIRSMPSLFRESRDEGWPQHLYRRRKEAKEISGLPVISG
jgi:hypothetical protein